MSANLHDLNTEDIRAELALRSTPPWQKVLLCDVLLSRQEEIRELTYSFDDLVGLLRREQLNRVLYTANEFTVTTILLVLAETKRRKMPQIEWFASDRSSQVGPMPLDQLIQWVNETEDNEVFFWREEWEQWKPLEKAPFWGVQPFFRQTFPTKEKQAATSNGGVNNSSSAMPVLMGIFQAVSFPFWLVMIFVAIFTGFNTFLGPLLPTVFATFMVFICIPLSIGLFLKKRWAWGMLLFTSIFGIIWFGGHVIIDGASKLWLLLAVFEGIILTLALTAKDAFS